ncbi:MAG: RNA-binding protein [Chloroflexota bacterium]
METKLFVGNLPYSASEEELQSLFTKAGSVRSVTLVRDRETGRSRGFAFVEMENQAEAENAIRMLNGSQVGGRPIVVNVARPRDDRGPRPETGGRPGQRYGGRGRRR